MKRYLLLVLLAFTGCERHPVSDLALLNSAKEEGVRPEPKRTGPMLENSEPGAKPPSETK